MLRTSLVLFQDADGLSKEWRIRSSLLRNNSATLFLVWQPREYALSVGICSQECRWTKEEDVQQRMMLSGIIIQECIYAGDCHVM